MSERDPLLGNPAGDTVVDDDASAKADVRVGPLDVSRATRYGILAGLWSATFLSAVNHTLIPTMLSSISSSFNKSNEASWLGTAYLLATCTFTPLYGRLCNVLGRQGAFQVALFFSTLGIFLCGMSQSMEMLIFARFLTGIGAGGLGTTSSIVVSDMYSMRSRSLTQGVANVFNGFGLGLGGPIGGLIADWLGWRWAFLIQIPLFFVSYILTTWNLNYTTEGAGRSAKEIMKRVDYLGSGSLLFAVGSILAFLSVRYNENLPWSHPAVLVSLALAFLFGASFLYVELFLSVEPVMAPFLLKQKIPVLVSASNFLVANCNFAIMYFLPMWFQTVMLTNASTAGLHLVPNSVSLSLGAVFAGWVMHKTGRYKTINLVFGALPFLGAFSIYTMNEDSGFIHLWFSIVPFGFGNAIVLQTMLIALLAHVPEDAMAVATGFGQLFRGLGQVFGVAFSSAIFQSRLEHELRKRIAGPGSDELIEQIRHSVRFVSDLPPETRRLAQDSYASSLRSVFLYSTCSTLLAFLVRLPVPDKELEHHSRKHEDEESPSSPVLASTDDLFDRGGDSSDDELEDGDSHPLAGPSLRRLSTYEAPEDVLSDIAVDTSISSRHKH